MKSATLAGGTSLSFPLIACSKDGTSSAGDRYAQLDAVLKQPVLKRELFPEPVIIERIELLRDRSNCICQVTSKDGAEGVSIGHPFIAKSSWPMFQHNLHHHFHGKDARDLDQLIFNAHELNVKRQGIPLCVQIASIEFAILDMLGIIANKPAGQLIGDLIHPEVAIYLGTRLGDLRHKEPQVSLELVKQDQEETRAKAIKLRRTRRQSWTEQRKRAWPNREARSYGSRAVWRRNGSDDRWQRHLRCRRSHPHR